MFEPTHTYNHQIIEKNLVSMIHTFCKRAKELSKQHKGLVKEGPYHRLR